MNEVPIEVISGLSIFDIIAKYRNKANYIQGFNSYVVKRPLSSATLCDIIEIIIHKEKVETLIIDDIEWVTEDNHPDSELIPVRLSSVSLDNGYLIKVVSYDDELSWVTDWYYAIN